MLRFKRNKPTPQPEAAEPELNETAENLVLEWWDSIHPLCDQFFESCAMFNSAASSDELNDLLHNMADARAAIEDAYYPIPAESARHHLLDAMTQMMEGFESAMRGELPADYDMVQEALRQFDTELQRLIA